MTEVLQPRRIQTSNGFVEVCPYCNNPIPPAYSFQDDANRIWSKLACERCGITFKLDGPFRSHQEANPRVFK